MLIGVNLVHVPPVNISQTESFPQAGNHRQTVEKKGISNMAMTRVCIRASTERTPRELTLDVYLSFRKYKIQVQRLPSQSRGKKVPQASTTLSRTLLSSLTCN